MLLEQISPLLIPLLFTGMVAGFAAGMLGVGGGIVIVPMLAYLLEAYGLHQSTPMHVAVGSSLAIIVSTSLLSAKAHFKMGNVDFTVIKQLGPFVFIGAFGGAIIANSLDNAALRVIFGMFALMIGMSFLRRAIVIATGLPSLPWRVILGSFIGLASSLTGIGGGSLTVPTLVAFGWDIRRAVGSSALMGLVIAVPGMTSFMIFGAGAGVDLTLSVGYVWFPAVVIIAAAAYTTTGFGARISAHIDQSLLRKIFGLFLILIGSRLIYGGLFAFGVI